MILSPACVIMTLDFAGRRVQTSRGCQWRGELSGHKSGYGTMVEVSHGDGLITRYAHNQENRSTWETGQARRRIALMGSSPFHGPTCPL